jgi:hypothetical protein
LAYLGVVSMLVAVAVHPLGLAQHPAFPWKREVLLSFGLCISAMAALFPYRLAVKNWFMVLSTKPASAVTRVLSSGLGRLAAIPIHLRNRIGLLLLPWVLLAINPNWPFKSLGSMDPWYYFGGPIHFPHYQRLNPSYAGERLMWILPGFVLADILSPVYGVLAFAYGLLRDSVYGRKKRTHSAYDRSCNPCQIPSGIRFPGTSSRRTAIATSTSAENSSSIITSLYLSSIHRLLFRVIRKDG